MASRTSPIPGFVGAFTETANSCHFMTYDAGRSGAKDETKPLAASPLRVSRLGWVHSATTGVQVWLRGRSVGPRLRLPMGTLGRTQHILIFTIYGVSRLKGLRIPSPSTHIPITSASAYLLLKWSTARRSISIFLSSDALLMSQPLCDTTARRFVR
jgi:hypothetical protein